MGRIIYEVLLCQLPFRRLLQVFVFGFFAVVGLTWPCSVLMVLTTFSAPEWRAVGLKRVEGFCSCQFLGFTD